MCHSNNNYRVMRTYYILAIVVEMYIHISKY